MADSSEAEGNRNTFVDVCPIDEDSQGEDGGARKNNSAPASPRRRSAGQRGFRSDSEQPPTADEEREAKEKQQEPIAAEPSGEAAGGAGTAPAPAAAEAPPGMDGAAPAEPTKAAGSAPQKQPWVGLRKADNTTWTDSWNAFSGPVVAPISRVQGKRPSIVSASLDSAESDSGSQPMLARSTTAPSTGKRSSFGLDLAAAASSGGATASRTSFIGEHSRNDGGLESVAEDSKASSAGLEAPGLAGGRRNKGSTGDDAPDAGVGSSGSGTKAKREDKEIDQFGEEDDDDDMTGLMMRRAATSQSVRGRRGSRRWSKEESGRRDSLASIMTDEGDLSYANYYASQLANGPLLPPVFPGAAAAAMQHAMAAAHQPGAEAALLQAAAARGFPAMPGRHDPMAAAFGAGPPGVLAPPLMPHLPAAPLPGQPLPGLGGAVDPSAHVLPLTCQPIAPGVSVVSSLHYHGVGVTPGAPPAVPGHRGSLTGGMGPLGALPGFPGAGAMGLPGPGATTPGLGAGGLGPLGAAGLGGALPGAFAGPPGVLSPEHSYMQHYAAQAAMTGAAHAHAHAAAMAATGGGAAAAAAYGHRGSCLAGAGHLAGAMPGAAAQLPAGEDNSPKTTVMLRNLPEGFTRNMLMELLDREGYKGYYDFLYMPMNFRTKAAFGYAFVNIVTPVEAWRFFEQFQGFTRWGQKTDKVCDASWSKIHQGLAVHIERYRNSPVMHVSVPDEYKPAMFQNGIRATFPPPTKNLRMPRIRKMTAGGAGGEDAEDAGEDEEDLG